MGAVPIDITALNGDRSGLTVSITPFQDDTTGPTVSSTGPTNSSSMEINVSEMSAGPVELDVVVTGNGMADWSFTLDLGIKKESRAPEISVTKTREGDNGSWDSEGYSYLLTGTVYDLDGDEVSIDIEICGYSTIIDPEGATWSSEVSVVGCNSHESYVIILTATDSWGKSTSISLSVMPPDEDTTPNKPSDSAATADEGGLPAPGVIATIAMLGLAGLRRRRIDSLQ
jgi:MYXO-CTERM domain-containing protein